MLPVPAWVQRSDVATLLAALGAADGATRLVGGIVRDGLLGLTSADIDMATRLAPDVVMKQVAAAGWKAVPTGLTHGTVTAVTPSLSIEVTTLRRDVATDGRHAQVAFTDDWQEDAARRDFTINALYAALPGGDVSDYFGGIDDLAARRVRFIGAPLQRIAEDHLRILRFFRFSARFAERLDADGLAACALRANDLMALSRERIANEMRGILAVEDPVTILSAMIAHGILVPVLPEITADRLPALARTVAAEGAGGVTADWRRRLAALLPAEAAAAVAGRLRLSNADKARVALASVPHCGGALLPLAWEIGAEAVVDRVLIAGDPSGDAASLQAWQRPRLPVSGRDVMARGITEGPEVARRLAMVERAWVAAGFPQDEATVTALLDHAVASA
ncbi:MAG: CCA tRNA nucleotidyltransferase [Polymorphobacter sp.]